MRATDKVKTMVNQNLGKMSPKTIGSAVVQAVFARRRVTRSKW
jgi:hypothetical protein